MKHSFFLISIFLFCIVSSDAGNRPEATKEDSIDAFTLTQWCALRKVGRQTTSTENVIEKAQSKSWFSNGWDWLTQPFKPVWGWYEEGGNKIYAPYTTFLSVYDSGVFENIRLKIKFPQNIYRYKTIYEDIYNNASIPNSGGCSYSGAHQYCIEATIAKNAAFVYLVGLGLDSSGNPIELTTDQRNAFKDQAITILRNLNTEGERFNEFGLQQWRSKELVQLLQAHDYLMYGARVRNEAYPYESTIEKRLHFYTYQLYSHSNNFVCYGDGTAGALRRYNNHALLVAGAVGMAAVVMHHYGVYFWLVQQKANRWAHAAHAYTSLSMWNVEEGAYTDGPNSKRGQVAGYAEGTHYFNYAFCNLLPFFRAFNNFVGGRETNNTYYQSLFDFTGQDVKNYYRDPDYDNLFRWYSELLQPNGDEPSIDDSYAGRSFPIEITGRAQYAVRKPQLIKFFDNVDLRADYMTVFNHYYETENIPAPITYFPDAGNIIVRSVVDNSGMRLPLSETHSIHVLCEKGVNLNGSKPFDLGHEHGDATSFIITAGEDELVIDPGYYGFTNRFQVNQGYDHNVITATNQYPQYNTPTTVTESPVILGGKTNFAVFTAYNDLQVKRKFSMRIGEKTYPYYVIEDSVYSAVNATVKFNLNGNGVSDIGSPSARSLNSHTIIFDHPCKKEVNSSNNIDNWKLRVTTSGNVYGSSTQTELGLHTYATHGTNSSGTYEMTGALVSGYGNICPITSTSASGVTVGEHAKAISELTLASMSSGKFLTLIEPLRCGVDDYAEIPHVREGEGHTTQSIKNSGIDSIGIVHYTRSLNSGTDTVINPFIINGSSAVLTIDAENAEMSYSQNRELRNAYCVTYTNFRKCGLENGNFLDYDDTTYISATNNIDVEFKITGKYLYNGYCRTQAATSVQFFLAGIDNTIEMIAVGGTSFSYDTNTYIMTINFPANQLTYFHIKSADPCKTSCYYPDSATNIVTTFTHGDGSSQYVSQPLKIIPDTGRLNIYSGSQMHICENKYLVNQDSLFLLKTVKTKAIDLNKCTPSQMFTELTTVGEQYRRSAIIVENKGALVLDSGSYTNIGDNSTLYIRNGGSLVIKAGAIVEIGGKYSGFGEIIMEDNSNLCVDSGAIIRFYADSADTTDDNRFYIMLHDFISGSPDVIPSLYKTQIRIQSNIEQKLMSDGIIPGTGEECQDPCEDFSYIMPPYGIYNRQWGYANFATPFATFTVAGDTLCPGDSVTIYMDKVLNEAQYKIKVCHLDSNGMEGNCSLNPADTTYAFEIDELWPGDPQGCLDLKRIPQKLKFILSDSGWYRIQVTVLNECGVSHDTLKNVYVPALPNVVFSIPDSSCPGYGTVIADGSSSNSYINHNEHRWTVLLITPDSIVEQVGETVNYASDWELDSSHVSSSFSFPGFKWIGGFKYAVGLTVKGWCGQITKWDTISIPLMVLIEARYATNYIDPLGNSSFQLQGIVEGATSWSWTPEDYMNYPDSLNPIVSPPDSIAYILTGNSASCSISDTIIIKHNNMAYAGVDSTICGGDTILMGTDFDAAIFFGFLYHLDPVHFPGMYYDHFTQYDLSPRTHFSYYMLRNFVGQGYTTIDAFQSMQTIRKVIRSQSWYNSYYQQFITGSDLSAFEYFDAQLSPSQEEAIEALPWLEGEIAEIFGNFQGFYNETPPESIWEYKFATDTVWHRDSIWDNTFNILVKPSYNVTYRLTVIDNDLSQIEYDEVELIVDTILEPRFDIAYQTDSTVYFTNLVNPNLVDSFAWDFGDGNFSTLFHPTHTFAAFDSTYRICLSVTNSCGTYTRCDSVHVDSFALVEFGFGKRGANRFDQPPTDTTTIVISGKSPSGDTLKASAVKENVLLENVPNPFNESTNITYAIGGEYTSASLRITDVLGRVIKEYSLQHMHGQVEFDGRAYKRGLYYSSLIADGIVIKSRTMVIER